MMIAWLTLAVLFLAYANGANDNFKGAATLFGSRTTSYRKALGWATLITFAGSCAALALSGGLVMVFSGKGLVPDLLTQDPRFLLAVGLGAALTVMLATVTGFPISTTHALTGGLVGAGLAAVGTVNAGKLGQSFFMPLAVSPILSFALTAALYPLFRFVRLRLRIERQMCLCVGGAAPQPVAVQPDGTVVLRSTGLSLELGQLSACMERYQGYVLGVDSQWVLDRLHFLSAGAVSFARGLNDTPKIVALLLAARALRIPLPVGLFAVGVLMAAGGLLNAKRVARTMSERITAMNHGQGFTANLVTAVLVMFASQWGLPVSTTHVSCGSLFGLGTVNRSARWSVVRNILLSWLVTLPLAALCAAGIYHFTSGGR
ncbi:MAG: inorganic phosphate transporter [Candidatus Omnitrophica bacterium]|nr:inorganic phosphate transporter [Candidatus Omnitrophota bacterium]